jgi:Tol biopolymer transport system component
MDGLQITSGWDNGFFSVMANGSMVFTPGGYTGKDRRLVMLDAEGRATDWSSERLPFEVGALPSPDGSRAASIIANSAGIYEIWVTQRGGTNPRRIVAREGADCSLPCWTVDGRTIAYSQGAHTEDDGIYTVNSDGTGAPRRLVKLPKWTSGLPTSWNLDGSLLFVSVIEGTKISVLAVRVSPTDGTAVAESLFVGESGNHTGAFLSPDNRLMAYQSDESGQSQIYVRPWGGSAFAGGGIPIGKGVGFGWMIWSRDGRKILFLDEAEKCVEVEILTQPRLAASAPRVLWDSRVTRTIDGGMGVLPDGHVLALRKGDAEDDVTRLDLVLGFSELLKQRLRQAAGK